MRPLRAGVVPPKAAVTPAAAVPWTRSRRLRVVMEDKESPGAAEVTCPLSQVLRRSRLVPGRGNEFQQIGQVLRLQALLQALRHQGRALAAQCLDLPSRDRRISAECLA